MDTPIQSVDKDSTSDQAAATSPRHIHEPGASGCSRCRALEARVAELEAAASLKPGDVSARATRESANFAPLEFKALRLIPHGWGEGWQLRPSPARRLWMDKLPRAYTCLPLVIANQWGWQILCPTDVRAIWDGTVGQTGLRIEVDPQYAPAIKSQFGDGIITFSPPWLFRTPPGWDLYAKGPSNRFKINCAPLEGIVETWWLNYTFTMNWKILEPGIVEFCRGESICQLMPVPHKTFENASAIESPIGFAEPKAAQELLEWLERRRLMAGQKVNVHQLYRKAEGIEEHLQSVSVPAFRSVMPWDPPEAQTGTADDGSKR